MNRQSIRFRLTLWYTLVLLSGLILFSVGSWITLKHSTESAKDQTLLHREKRLIDTLRVPLPSLVKVGWQDRLTFYSLNVPESNLVQVFDTAGRRIFPETASVGKLPWPSGVCRTPCFGEFWLHGHLIRATSHLVQVGDRRMRICIGGSLDEHEAILTRYRDALFAMIPLLCLFSVAGGYVLSRRALSPVDRLTTASLNISISNLSERLPVTATGDEIERLTQAWNGLLDRLETAVSRLMQFTADASHDFRTAITVMLITGQLALKRHRSEEEYREALETVVAECQSTARLLDDLLVLARADAYSSSISKSNVDLVEIMRESCKRMRRLAESKQQTFQCCAPATAVSMQGNDALLGRLITILLDNAIKYTQQGGHILVTLAAEAGGRVELRVEDNGIGIDPAVQPRIFDRFFRADPVRNRESGGTGLGLAIAKWIVDAHGARISVAGAPGQGTVCCVVFSGV